MSTPAKQAGKQSEPCKDCGNPIGDHGAWYPHPFNGFPSYGICPACHDARWTRFLAQAESTVIGPEANKDRPQ